MGAILPLIPGPPIVWLGAFYYAWRTNFDEVGIVDAGAARTPRHCRRHRRLVARAIWVRRKAARRGGRRWRALSAASSGFSSSTSSGMVLGSSLRSCWLNTAPPRLAACHACRKRLPGWVVARKHRRDRYMCLDDRVILCRSRSVRYSISCPRDHNHDLTGRYIRTFVRIYGPVKCLWSSAFSLNPRNKRREEKEITGL